MAPFFRGTCCVVPSAVTREIVNTFVLPWQWSRMAILIYVIIVVSLSVYNSEECLWRLPEIGLQVMLLAAWGKLCESPPTANVPLSGLCRYSAARVA